MEATETQFVCLYRGKTIDEAKIVAVTAEPMYVNRFVDMLSESVPVEPGRQPALHVVSEPLDAA